MAHGPQAPSKLPANLFFDSPEQRVSLARQRFFEDGVRPSGMVSEAVIQSWSRCLRSHADPARPAVFEPVTASRVHSALRSNRQLLEAAGDGLQQLRVTLAGTSGTAMLTDAQGVIIGSTFTQGRSHERLMPVTTRIGVNLAEEAVGTTAPGITVRSAQASVVLGSEHFFGNVQTMHCAAAPILDVRGQLAGVLDISSEGIPFGFDAASVVAHYAADIENRLLCAQSTEHLVLRLQMTPAMLRTPMAGLVGIKGDGRIDWLNGAAARLLGHRHAHASQASPWAEDNLGLTLSALMDMARLDAPQALVLPNGLRLWAQAQWQARDGARDLTAVATDAATSAHTGTPHATPLATPPGDVPAASVDKPSSQHACNGDPGSGTTWRESEHDIVARVLSQCGGNVSQAARSLGVSRGRVYRHMRRAQGDQDA